MFADIINQIKEKQPEILIIGDLMLDKFIFGNVERISPEAPVPIVKLQNEKHERCNWLPTSFSFVL